MYLFSYCLYQIKTENYFVPYYILPRAEKNMVVTQNVLDTWKLASSPDKETLSWNFPLPHFTFSNLPSNFIHHSVLKIHNL